MELIQYTPNRITIDLVLKAKAVLESGGVVAHPTETVYGLTANMFNDEAIKKVYRLKKRSTDKPLSVMVRNVDQIDTLIGGISDRARKFCEALFPAPVTIILPIQKSLKSPFFKHLDYLGFRIPDHELCQDLMASVNFPLITTSANISEQKTPQLASEIVIEFDEDLDLILDGGKTGNISSTIIKYDDEGIEFLREGVIPKEKILEFDV